MSVQESDKILLQDTFTGQRIELRFTNGFLMNASLIIVLVLVALLFILHVL